MDRLKEIKKTKSLESMKKILEYSLSDSDIRHILGDNCKIVEYNDLDKFESMEDLLPNDTDYVVILIESAPSKGHWCSITKANKRITLFDSYGSKLEDELNFISKAMNRMLGNTKQELENLIKSVPDDYEVIYNKTKLQAEKPDISTCGRWNCAWLQMFKLGYDLEEFLRIVEEQCKSTGLPPDVLMCKWIPLVK
jgi:hypothetical protein